MGDTTNKPGGYRLVWPAAAAVWRGPELDDTARPVMLAAKLADLGHPADPDIIAMITAAIGFLVRTVAHRAGPLGRGPRRQPVHVGNRDRGPGRRRGIPFRPGSAIRPGP